MLSHLKLAVGEKYLKVDRPQRDGNRGCNTIDQGEKTARFGAQGETIPLAIASSLQPAWGYQLQSFVSSTSHIPGLPYSGFDKLLPLPSCKHSHDNESYGSALF